MVLNCLTLVFYNVHKKRAVGIYNMYNVSLLQPFTVSMA